MSINFDGVADKGVEGWEEETECQEKRAYKVLLVISIAIIV